MRLVSISICSNETPGGCINGFSFTYVDQTGEAISSGTWGTTIIGCVTTVISHGLSHPPNPIYGVYSISTSY